MRLGCVLLASVLSLAAFAQDKTGLSPSKPATKISAAGAPVTQAEAATVFQRADSVIRSVLKAKPGAKTGLTSGKTVATRVQIIKEMDRLFEMARPSFKLTPTRVKHDPAAFTIKDAAAKGTLSKLVSWGCVAKIGPLATAGREGLTVAQFGDAVGFFLLRLSELTHMPSTKWSPYLQPGD